MRWLRILRLRLRSLLWRSRVEQEIDLELRYHLERQIEELIAAGANPNDARSAALRAMGNLDRQREACRDSLGLRLLDETRQDVRYAGRALIKSPGFALIGIVTLALGVGANAAIFSVINAVLLRPLPYPDADRLVRFIEHLPPDVSGGIGYPQPQRLAGLLVSDLPAFRSQATTLSHVGVYAGTSPLLTGRGEPVRLEGMRVSPAVFAMLGVRPHLGRTFESHEETPGNDAVVVLSFNIWQRYFGRSPDVLGERLIFDGRAFAVIGVMPEGFHFPDPQPQFWTPYALGAMRARVPPIARLADGVTTEVASAQVDGILGQMRATEPLPAGRSHFEVARIQEQLVAPVRPALIALAVAVCFVLLIACVNVMNLTLARTAAREREMAVRLAIGASRGRLARQCLTESLLLALVSGAAGMVVALGGVAFLHRLGGSMPRPDLTPGVSIPRLEEIGIDLSVLAFTVMVSILAGVLAGLTPALRQLRSHEIDALRGSTSSAPGGFNVFRRHRMQGMLIIAEIAMAIVLLVGGGLLMHSFINLTRVDPGYDPANVLTFNVYSAASRRPAGFEEDLTARLRLLPGVRSAGYAELLPMVRFRTGMPLRPVQPTPAGTPPLDSLDARVVSRDFLQAMGVHVLEGRGFGVHDGAGQPKVMLINRTLARSGYLGANPVGAYVYAVGPAPWQVIGIVEDVHQYGLDQQPSPQVFTDARQLPMGNPNPYYAVRVDGTPTALTATIRGIVKQLDPQGIVGTVATMEQVVSNSMSRPRLYATLVGLFAIIAAALAAVGIYGVMAYAVVQRTREIGIRMALGAARRSVIALVLAQSLALIVAGIAIGLAAATAVARYLDGLLFGLTALDMTTFVVAALTFAALATIAAYMPARRATRVNPVVALRCE